MSSLVERLRVRSDRKPIYNIDESDDDADFLPRKHGATQEKFERIVRSDAKENSCQACGESGNLLSCETCTYAFHPRCLLQPLTSPLSDNWTCPECVSPLNNIDKILDCEMRPAVAAKSDATKSGSNQNIVKQYLVKWKGLSYLHCTWVPEEEFLKAFKTHPRLKTKVANFEYIDEVEAAAEDARKRAMENNSSANSSGRTNYWEELLRDRYQEHKVEELNALGKGKRSRNKWQVSFKGDDFTGLEDVSSDGENDNYEAYLTDDDSNSTGNISNKRPYKKKARAADNTQPHPLMEGEGKSLRILGFNQNQRAAFVQILMRYGILFLSHIDEDITDSSTFTDGVPKEGLRIKDLLVRIAVLLLIRNKVKFAAENPGSPLFSDDILSHYAGLKGVKIWKEGHDLLLLQAVLKIGYGRWQAIIDDKDLKIQEVICLELNIPFINLAVPGQVGSRVQNNANMIMAESTCNQSRENGGSGIAADGINVTNAESTCNQSRENGDTAI